MLNDEKRGVEEAYTSAGNSSDLRVEAEVRTDADIIIAAGWSESRVGIALLRLHSEWDKAVIAYWLDQTCHHCSGLKFLKIEGAPSLSTKACRPCSGSGIAPVPHGQEGRRVANYMDDCLQKGRDSIRRNLSQHREASAKKEKDVASA
jgi:hypothetical protein